MESDEEELGWSNLSPSASQRLIENYKENFVKKWEQKFAENMENKDPNTFPTLMETCKKELQSSWAEKLGKCDPDVYAAYNEEEEWDSISSIHDPAIRDSCIELKKWVKEIKRENAEKGWRSNVISGSRHQTKLLTEIQKQLQAIQKSQREQEDINRQWQKAIKLAGGVLIMALIVYLLIKSFF
jgi:hypothetical protein